MCVFIAIEAHCVANGINRTAFFDKPNSMAAVDNIVFSVHCAVRGCANADEIVPISFSTSSVHTILIDPHNGPKTTPLDSR